jgi:hypothetical protein
MRYSRTILAVGALVAAVAAVILSFTLECGTAPSGGPVPVLVAIAAVAAGAATTIALTEPGRLTGIAVGAGIVVAVAIGVIDFFAALFATLFHCGS